MGFRGAGRIGEERGPRLRFGFPVAPFTGGG